MIKIKLDLEKVILILFFVVLLYIGPATVLDYRIAHEFPFGYFASDAFQHQVRAEAIKNAGNFRYEAPYISQGFEKVVGRYPPVLYHLSVMLSHASGIATYDSINFIVFLFAIIGILITYLIIRDFNRNIAIISLPLTMLTFSFPTSIGFTWGHWPSLLGQFFLIVFFWCIMKIELDKSYALIAITLTAIILTHTSEAFFAIIFLGVWFLARLIGKSLRKSDIKNLIIAFILALIATAHFLIIFKNTWFLAQPYSFFVMPVWDGNPGFYISNFGLLLTFIALGVVFSLFKLSGMHTSLAVAFAMLLSGFMNYIGFEVRSFQIRFFWPIYLSVFFGFGIYMILKFAIKRWNIVYTIIVFAVFAVLLSGIFKLPNVPHYAKSTSQGIMDPYHWDAFKWISSKTEANSRVYFFYADIYSQDALLRNSKRTHYQVDPENYVKDLQERKIKRKYISEMPGDGGGGIVLRKGLFSFESLVLTKPPEYFSGPQDICNFNYLIFDKVSRPEVLAQYNMLIASELVKKDYIKPVFENEVVVILKNSNVGADCIEERDF